MTENESFSSVYHINGYPLCYEKFGFGPKPVLMIPGGIGTVRSDFWPQLFGEDALNPKMFTLIVVEAPGWGRSGPPARKYNSNVHNNDSECFYGLMKHLGFDHFSVIGWSDGAKTALNMSIKYSESITALVVSGVSYYISKSCIKCMNNNMDVNDWEQQKIDMYLKCYESEERIQELWSKFIRFMNQFNTYFNYDMFKDKYHLIKCPVLIIFGEKDPTTDVQQSEHLRKNIRRSQLLTFPSAGHDFHLMFPTKFKELAEKMLSKY